ncbi:SMI1/KNR4 family protein [Pseudoneobacillus sp. C159]
MNEIIWKRVKPLEPVTSIEIFESDHGFTVPEFLKDFIHQYNGGRPSLDITKTKSGREVQIKTFLSFNKKDIETVHNVIGYFKKQFHGNLLPFASEPSGDYFCVDLTNLSIVYWEHETNEIQKVADNFYKFINGLYSL